MPVVTEEMIASFERITEQVQDYKAALKIIANLWPDPSCSAAIRDVAGINDGRSRALIADEAVRQARKALGMEYCSYDGEIFPAKP